MATTPVVAIPDSGPLVPQKDTPEIMERLLRDAFGELMIALVESPDLARWAEARGTAWSWPQEPATDGVATASAGVTLAVCSRRHGCSENESTVAVGKALRSLDPSIELVSAESLLSALYPLVERRSLSDEQTFELLRQPAVAARACQAGVRHLVIGEILDQWHTGHGFLGSGYPGGVFGLAWRKDHQAARLRVFDLVAGKDLGAIRRQREDVTWVVPAFVLPLPIPTMLPGDAMPETVAKQLLPLLRPEH